MGGAEEFSAESGERLSPRLQRCQFGSCKHKRTAELMPHILSAIPIAALEVIGILAVVMIVEATGFGDAEAMLEA